MASAVRKLVTVEDWLNIPDDGDERCELIEGDLVYKTLPSYEHGEFTSRLNGDLSSLVKKSEGNPPTGWWFSNEVAVIYEGRPNGFIHDIAGWRRDRHKEKPKGRRVVVKPDWVCEILSGNRKNDTVTKKWVLHEHRVEYYWIVDLEEEIISIFEWYEKGYVCIADVKKGDKNRLKPFESIEIDVAFLLGHDE